MIAISLPYTKNCSARARVLLRAFYKREILGEGHINTSETIDITA